VLRSFFDDLRRSSDVPYHYRINEGHTIETAEIPSVPILTSDVYEWAPGGFFVVHSAFGKIGETAVGGVEIIGVDGGAYRSTFYDSFGNVHRPGRPPRVQRRRRELDRIDGRDATQGRLRGRAGPRASVRDTSIGWISVS
jgi:hypothetical protein